MDLKKAVDLFLNNQKLSTRESYQYELFAMRDFLGPARLCEEIKPALLIEYVQSFNQKKWAEATKQKHIKTIKTFFNWLVRIEVIVSSPAKAVKGKKLPTYVSRDKAITDQELEILLDYCRWDPRKTALLLFLADTGARIGGCAGLKWEHLNLATMRGIVTEKGDKSRPVWFGEKCRNALIKWQFVQEAKRGYVFSVSGEPIKADNLSQIVRRLCQAVGIRVISAHAFRHRKGHQLADDRVAVTIAATALGHSDPIITMHHYYPADYESAEAAIRALSLEKIPEAPEIPTNIIPMKKRSG